MCLAESSALRRAYNWIEYRKFKREEVATWRHVSACVTTSTREEEIIKRVVTTPTLTVPNAVDVAYFRPSDTVPDPNAIVLTGLMKYRPNVDAAIYFVNEILPKILAVRPNAIFYAVGGEPPEDVTRLAGPNVVVTGTVPDVRPYVHKASVIVVPLRMGGGTRLKVLEGLSMRKPMVSTSLGCEGIDVEHGRHLLIADDANLFATAVLDVLDKPPLAESLATAGRELVERKYMWESVVQDLEGLYVDLIGRRHSA